MNIFKTFTYLIFFTNFSFYLMNLLQAAPPAALTPSSSEQETMTKLRKLFQLDEENEMSEEQKKLKQNKIIKKIKKIEAATLKTLNLYRGLDPEIGQLSSLFMELIRDPDNINKVVWVPLLGFPGVGKTSAPKKFLELLGWNYALLEHRVKHGDEGLPFEEIIQRVKNLQNNRTIGKAPRLIVLLDEFGEMNDVDNFSLANKVKWFKQLDELWDALGTGKMEEDFPRHRSPQDLIRELKNLTVQNTDDLQGIEILQEKINNIKSKIREMEKSGSGLAAEKKIIFNHFSQLNEKSDVIDRLSKLIEIKEKNSRTMTTLENLIKNIEENAGAERIQANILQITQEQWSKLNGLGNKSQDNFINIIRDEYQSITLSQMIKTIKLKIIPLKDILTLFPILLKNDLQKIENQISLLNNQYQDLHFVLNEEMPAYVQQEYVKAITETRIAREKLEKFQNKIDENSNAILLMGNELNALMNKQNFNNHNLKCNQVIAYSIIRKMAEHHPHLLVSPQFKKIIPTDLFLTAFDENPDLFTQFLTEGLKRVSNKKMTSFGQVIIIATGNPKPLIDVMQKFHQLPVNERTFDKLQNLTKELAAPEIMQKWFEHKVGLDIKDKSLVINPQALSSRLRGPQWSKFIAPFSLEKWQEFALGAIHSRAQDLSDKLADDFGIKDITFEYLDPQLTKLIYQPGPLDFGGPRNFNLDEVERLGRPFMELSGALVHFALQHPPSLLPPDHLKIHLAWEEHSQKMFAKGKYSSQPLHEFYFEYAHLKAKGETPLILSHPKSSDTIMAKDDLSTLQAAAAIIGFMFHGILPQELNLEPIDDYHFFDKLYFDLASPPFSLNQLKAMAMMHLSSKVAFDVLTNQKSNPDQDKYLFRVKNILDEIKSQIRNAKNTNSRLGLPFELSSILPHPLDEDPFFQMINSEALSSDYKEVINLSQKVLFRLLSGQKELLTTLKMRLLKKEHLSTAELKEIFTVFFKVTPEKGIFYHPLDFSSLLEKMQSDSCDESQHLLTPLFQAEFLK